MIETITNEEAKEIFYNALCNGLNYIEGYDIYPVYSQKIYNESKERLLTEDPSTALYLEDILLDIIFNGGLLFNDDNSEETINVTPELLYKNIQLVPIETLWEIAKEVDDADTADIVLQTVLFGEVIYG